MQEVVWDIPLVQLLLMLRMKVFMEKENPGIQLSTIEFID